MHPPTSGDAVQELVHLENAVTDHLFELQPSYAVFLGLHQYDGRLPRLSREATDAWVRDSDHLLDRLTALSEERLPPERRLDRLLLRLLLESARFDLKDSRDYDRNPMTYVGAASLTAYMVRDYAPLPQRADAMVRTLREVPRLLAEGRARLDAVLPEPFVRLAQTIGQGLPDHYAEAEELARHASPALVEEMRVARAPAEAAVKGFLAALQQEYAPRATSEFALGAERFQRLLWVREGIETPFAQIRDAGLADLRRNQARLAEISAQRVPPTPVPVLLEELHGDHPSAESLLPEAQGFIDETRRFVETDDLVTIPPQAACRVEETPTYGRALFTASMFFR